MMIKVTQKQIVDERFKGSLIRYYADFQAQGWLAAINIVPAWANYSDFLNVDIVLSSVPRFLVGRINFKYGNGKRLATRRAGLGSFDHIHLSCTLEQINQLIDRLGRPVRLYGQEVAIQQGRGSMFWADHRAIDWMGLPPNHPLAADVETILKTTPTDTNQCHSVFLVSVGGLLSEHAIGSQMGGHFAAAATGVSGFGQKTAESSMRKAREAAQKKKQQPHAVEDVRKQRQQQSRKEK